MQRPQPPTPHPTTTRRGAFTLVELIVVIMIIAILASMLFVGVFRGMGTVREAQVSTEINGLDKAIADFRLEYGVNPPSSFRFRENGEYTNSPLDRNSIAFMRQVWPNYNPNMGGDLNGDGEMNGVFTMNGAQCLVFFLGGPGVLQSPPVANGFSTNPSNPFAPSQNRVGPFVEFDPARFVQLQPGQVPGYRDPRPDQTMPYQYFSSYDGRGYQPGGYSGFSDPSDNEVITLNGQPTMVSVYLQRDNNWGNPDAIPAGEPWNRRSFQIIAPNAETGGYGRGGLYSSEQGIAFSPDEEDSHRRRSARAEEQGVITNFSGGRLERMFPVAPPQ
jgi:prepilin-type N-terminal cleavage/methylation domain-containing protein